MKMVYPCDAEAVTDKILRDFVGTCDDLGIRYCLIGGTCLGFYRDGSYIRGDNDIDIWVDCDPVESECYTALTGRLLELGFTVYRSYHFSRDGILTDVWTRDRPPTGQRGQITAASFALLVDTFDTIVYNNRDYNIPHPAEEYLERFYGRDWRIPKRKGE